MPTYSFIAFLLLGYLLTKVLNPKNGLLIFLYSFFIPLAFLVITVLIFGGGNAYLSGQITNECTISTAATMLLMGVLFIGKKN